MKKLFWSFAKLKWERNGIKIFLIFILLSIIFLGLIEWLGPRAIDSGSPESSRRVLHVSTQPPTGKHGDSEYLGSAQEQAPSSFGLDGRKQREELSTRAKTIRVKGVVITRQGEGVSLAQVYLFCLNSATHLTPYRCLTDENGFLAFHGIPSGEFTIFAEKGNLRSKNVLFSSRGEDIEGLTVILPARGKIVGLISDRNGGPLIEAAISIVTGGDSGSPPSSNRSLQSLMDGTFLIDELDVGTPVKLSFSKSGFLDVEELVTLVPGTEVYPLKVIMEEAGKISGRVVDEAGNPVVGAKVYLRGSEKLQGKFSQTDAYGFFKALDLQEQLYDATVTAEGLSPKKVKSVPVNSSALTIELSKGASISGKIVFGELNISQSFTVEPLPSNPDSISLYDPNRIKTFHNPENAFTLPSLPPGEYSLKVESDGWAVAYDERVSVPAEGVVDNISISMEREITISGAVSRRDTGEPLSSVLVYLVKDTGPYVPFQTKVSDGEGRFTFRSIPEGNYSVVAGRGDLRYQSETFYLDPGRDYQERSLVVDENPAIELPQPVYPAVTGIGAIVGRYEDVIRIEKVIPRGPAETGGLQNGDIILEVDHISTKTLSLLDVLDKIRGEEGTSVFLGINRDGHYFQDEIIRQRLGY